MVARHTISDEQRRRNRSILREDRITAVGEVVSLAEKPPALPLVRIHDGSFIQELGAAWIEGPLRRLAAASDELEAVSFTDPGYAGELIDRWDEATAAARQVASLAAFFGGFEPTREDAVSELVRAGCHGLLAQWGSVALSLVRDPVGGDTHPLVAPEDRQAGTDILWMLDQVEGQDVGPPDPVEVLQIAFGDPTASAAPNPNIPDEMLRAGALQLQRIADPAQIPAGSEHHYLSLAVRLAGEQRGLIAHRAATLMHELVEDAYQASPAETAEELRRFMGQEAAWIQSAGADVERSLRAFYKQKEPGESVRAYQSLTEGILRPYGWLAFRLIQTAGGNHPGPWSDPPLLTDLCRRLATTEAKLGVLLDLLVIPKLRNIGAHSDAALIGGELVVKSADGTITTLGTREIEHTYFSLRAALTGMDAAFSVAFMVHPIGTPQNPIFSDATYLGMTQLAADLHTNGDVLALKVEGDSATITVRDINDQAELMLVAEPLIRVSGRKIRRVLIVDPEGCPRGELKVNDK